MGKAQWNENGPCLGIVAGFFGFIIGMFLNICFIPVFILYTIFLIMILLLLFIFLTVSCGWCKMCCTTRRSE